MVDELQLERVFSNQDLKELFTFVDSDDDAADPGTSTSTSGSQRGEGSAENLVVKKTKYDPSLAAKKQKGKDVNLLKKDVVVIIALTSVCVCVCVCCSLASWTSLSADPLSPSLID